MAIAPDRPDVNVSQENITSLAKMAITKGMIPGAGPPADWSVVLDDGGNVALTVTISGDKSTAYCIVKIQPDDRALRRRP